MLSAPTSTAPASRRRCDQRRVGCGRRVARARPSQPAQRREALDVEQVLHRDTARRRAAAARSPRARRRVDRAPPRAARSLGDDVGEGVDCARRWRRCARGSPRAIARADRARAHRVGASSRRCRQQLAAFTRGAAACGARRTVDRLRRRLVGERRRRERLGAGSSSMSSGARAACRRARRARSSASTPARASARAAGRARRRSVDVAATRAESCGDARAIARQRRTSRWKISRLRFFVAMKLGSDSVATVRGRASS